MHIKTRF